VCVLGNSRLNFNLLPPLLTLPASPFPSPHGPSATLRNGHRPSWLFAWNDGRPVPVSHFAASEMIDAAAASPALLGKAGTLTLLYPGSSASLKSFSLKGLAGSSPRLAWGIRALGRPTARRGLDARCCFGGFSKFFFHNRLSRVLCV